jgi:hypothetical protein
VIPEMIFVNVILPGLTVRVEGGLEGQHHAIQQLVKNKRHRVVLLAAEPKDLNGPVCQPSLLDTPKRQPGAHQEVLVRDFVQEPDSGIVCNPRMEIEDGRLRRGTITRRGKD